MGKVSPGFSMSLDGFIAGPQDDVSRLFQQQCLKAGLLEEIHIDLVPVLLGAGIRLFDHLDSPIELESTEVTESTGVTHLTFRVVK